MAPVYRLKSIGLTHRFVFGAAAGLAGQGFRQLAFFPIILAMTWGSLAQSPDDYNYPIGKIDAQIRCKQGGHRATETPVVDDRACMDEFRDTVARSGDDLIYKLDDQKGHKWEWQSLPADSRGRLCYLQTGWVYRGISTVRVE